MRRLAFLVAALLALPAWAAEEDLPLPPPPPSDDVPLPPPPTGTERVPAAIDVPTARRAPPPLPGPGERPTSPLAAAPIARPAGTIGEGPIAPAGDQVAPLQPDESYSHWRLGLASGVLSRFGGMQLSSRRENPSTLIYLGGQADGAWTEGYGQAVRLRFRVMTGGENEVFIPSDGEVEAAYMIGRPEFRFVLGRIELARYPNLALQVYGQLATLPSVEGSVRLVGDTMRLSYSVAPVEMAYVYYYGSAHIDRAAVASSESAEPAAATAARLRYTLLLPPSVLFSLQGDIMKMWNKADLLFSGEGSLGYQVLDQTVTFNVAVRWTSYRRRAPEAADATATSTDMKLMGMATLVF